MIIINSRYCCFWLPQGIVAMIDQFCHVRSYHLFGLMTKAKTTYPAQLTIPMLNQGWIFLGGGGGQGVAIPPPPKWSESDILSRANALIYILLTYTECAI